MLRRANVERRDNARGVHLFHYHLVTSQVRTVEARYLGKLGFRLVARYGRMGDRSVSAEPGVSYTLESLQGLVLQVELLSRNGYPDAWQWSSAALLRTALLVNRSAAAGGEGWDGASVNAHLPWILNARYGLSIPTRPAGFGRTFGFTDWLYGG